VGASLLGRTNRRHRHWSKQNQGSCLNSSDEVHPGFYCINETDGKLIWRFWANGMISSSPAVFENRVFFGSLAAYPAHGKVYCLNVTNGALIWNYTPDGKINDYYDGSYYSSPAVANGRVFIGLHWEGGDAYTRNASVYCLNASDGSFIWQYEVTSRKDVP